MFSGKNKRKKNSRNKNTKDIYIDNSTRNVGHSPVDLAPLLRKMEKRKKASRVLGILSSFIIIIGLAASGYYVYKMFQPIESASISFDDIQDATPEEKQKSEENRNKPLNYANNDEAGSKETDSKDNNKSKKKNNKNIQNGNVPSYIDDLPEKTSYIFNGSIFASDNNDDSTEDEGNASDENNAEEEDNNIIYGTTEEDDDENNHKENHKKSSNSSKNSTKKKSASTNETKSKKVTLTIVGYNGDRILDTKSIKYTGTQTVASILFAACNKYDIPYKYKGSGSTIYISSMGGQAEKEHGSGSGWMVRVNGYLIDRSAGAWKVKDDDDIEWFYYSGSLEDIPRE